MTKRLLGRFLAVLALSAGYPAVSQELPTDKALVAALDRAFKPGFLETARVRKNSDGTYSRLVSTGDAIKRPTFGKPLAAARATCTAAGGVLTSTVDARAMREQQMQVGDQRLMLDRLTLELLMPSYLKFPDHRSMFRTSYFADRAARQADADPPFGIFTCALGASTIWAVAILPDGEPSGYDLLIRVTAITQAWVKAHNASAVAAQAKAAREEQYQSRRRVEEAEREALEVRRLKPFQAGLRIGSRTNCGIVVDVREPLVKVQLPPNISGPNGAREFWVPRDELADYAPPWRCRFGG